MNAASQAPRRCIVPLVGRAKSIAVGRLLSIGLVGVVLVVGLIVYASSRSAGSVAEAPGRGVSPLPVPARVQSNVLLAAGDIATCGSSGAAATARIIARSQGVVVALGDEAYPDGSRANFTQCYARAWGRFRARTRPTPGNHEYHQTDAAPYFAYFGGAAGVAGRGYYSYTVGGWHIVSLNSNCSHIGGCDRGSAEERWLRADLAAHPARCTLAYWHHPRFSSGTAHGSDSEMEPIWQDLYADGADVVLSGHEHNYERFAPQTASGRRDSRRGIREFVVGTGGKNHYDDFERPIANSEIRSAETYGILKLTLGRAGYRWQFIPVAGGIFRDAGSGRCHR